MVSFSFVPSRLATVATAAALGAALLVTPATTADAATDSHWDRLAQCESGGNWSINTGNGYYGGVQFSLPSWKAAGGTRFASRPDLAPRVAQVWAAERLLDIQGWGAWPACTRKLGYTARDAQGTPLSVRRALTSDGRWKTRVQRTGHADVLAGRDVTSRFVVRTTTGRTLSKLPVRVCTKPKGGTLRCVKRVTDGRGRVLTEIDNATRSARVWARALETNRTAASRSSERRVVVRPTMAVSRASLSVLDSATQQELPASRAGVVVVDVGPDRRSLDYEVRLQQRQDGEWVRVRTLRTSGRADSVSEAVDPGTYRAVIPPQHNMARRIGTAVTVTG